MKRHVCKIFSHAIFSKQFNFKVLFQSYVTLEDIFMHPVLSLRPSVKIFCLPEENLRLSLPEDTSDLSNVLLPLFEVNITSHILGHQNKTVAPFIKHDYIVFSLPASSLFQIFNSQEAVE